MTILEITRLILRPLRDDDAEGYINLIDNWNVAKTVASVPHPYSRADFDAFLAIQKSKAPDTRVPSFAIELKEGPDHAIGYIGLRPAPGGEESVASLGYWIGEDWWGKGLVSEATSAVLACAFEHLSYKTVDAGYAIANPASGRILEKHGFVVTGEADIYSLANDKKLPTKLLTLSREDWRSHDKT